MDRDAIISEVMRRVDIRLGRSDPLWAVIEMNRILLEESVELLLERAAPMAAEIRSAGLELTRSTAASATRSIMNDLGFARQKIASEADEARKEASIAIHSLAKSHRRDEAMKWFCTGVAIAAVLAAASFYAGTFCATTTRPIVADSTQDQRMVHHRPNIGFLEEFPSQNWVNSKDSNRPSFTDPNFIDLPLVLPEPNSRRNADDQGDHGHFGP